MKLMTARERTRSCRVCGEPCCGHVCKACHHTKNNKIAGRYAKKFDTYKNKDRWSGVWSVEKIK